MGVDASTAGCRLHPPFRSISSVCHSSSTLPEDQHSLFFSLSLSLLSLLLFSCTYRYGMNYNTQKIAFDFSRRVDIIHIDIRDSSVDFGNWIQSSFIWWNWAKKRENKIPQKKKKNETFKLFKDDIFLFLHRWLNSFFKCIQPKRGA
jgi:hypothetical protein